jgi:hypothetical protein
MNGSTFPSPEQVAAVARPRSLGQYRGTGRYPVTVGGYVVGYVEKRADALMTFWVALDENERQVGDTYGQRSQAVARVAKTDGARWAYRAAALEGVFGFAEQRAAEVAP